MIIRLPSEDDDLNLILIQFKRVSKLKNISHKKVIIRMLQITMLN